MIQRFSAAIFTVMLAACAGKPKAASPEADTTSTPITRDSAAPGLMERGAVNPARDSVKTPTPAAKSPAPQKETGDYDRAIKPRFKIDEKTGKVDSIKRP